MKEKYFHVVNPLTDIVNKQGSWIWQGICTGLNIIKRHYIWEIGDGTSVQIWKDTWIPNMHRPPDSHFSSFNMKTVNQLIDQDSKSWNSDILNALFDEDTVKRITDIRIPIAGKDKLRWEPSSNGMFTIKSAYNAILNENLATKPTKNNLDICWKSFWRYKLPPRIQYFIWKFLHGCITTKHRLARFTKHKDSRCAICSGNPETIQHLFFDCHHVRHIWDSVDSILSTILQGLDLQNWISGFFLKANNGMPKDFSLYESASFILWLTWKARCDTVFENKPFNSNIVINNIVRQIEDWKRAKSMQTSSNSALRIIDKNWKAPIDDIYKLNFDASYIDKTVLSGWGLICRDSAGNSHGLRGGASLAIDPEQAEAHSLLEAVQWAHSKGWRKIHLEGDCQNVIAAVNGKATTVKWTTYNLIHDALVILSYFDSWVCTYAHRDANHIADSIAKYARTQTICFCWFNNLSVWINLLIQQDKNNM